MCRVSGGVVETRDGFRGFIPDCTLVLIVMRQVDTTDEVDEYESAIRVGVSSTSYSPMFAVPEEVVERAENGEYADVEKRVAEWWESLNRLERAEVLNLGEMDGESMIEQIGFIDALDKEYDQMEPVWEA